MFLTRLKRVALALVVSGTIGLGGAFLSRNMARAQPDKPSKPSPSSVASTSDTPADVKYVEAVKKDLAALQGEWEVESFIGYGRNLDLPPTREKRTLRISGNKATLFIGPQVLRMTWLIDPTTQPKTLDILYEPSPAGAKAEGSAFAGKVGPAIYELDGEALKDCSDDPGGTRPEAFVSLPRTSRSLMVFKRVRH
jgi:uncharacterized protein (TIGR03067 family)